MMLLLLCVAGYVLGSIPFALFFTRSVGDIRKQGSGNVGATNVLRTAGKWRALATLVCDVAKGTLPVLLAQHVWGISQTDAALVGTAAIVGHIVPIWLKGHGGKGVATTLGVYLAMDYRVTLITVCVWLVVARLFKISSLSALVALMMSPILAWFLDGEASLVWWMAAVWLAMLITHRENIRRLWCGEELGCSNTGAQKSTEESPA